jgi:NAD(P)-dependent dehydrogenase (short-subunit alcohol dehydrogenase family)
VKPYNIRTTVISPGTVVTELPNTTTEQDIAEKVCKSYEIAIPAESFARAVAFAISQPEEVDVNEILFGPRARFCKAREAGDHLATIIHVRICLTMVCQSGISTATSTFG